MLPSMERMIALFHSMFSDKDLFAIKSSCVIEDITSIPYTDVQEQLLEDEIIDPLSDMADHLIYYTNEECSIVRRVITTLACMPDTPEEDVHDPIRVLQAIRTAFPEGNVIDMQIRHGCVWDPRQRDTQLQFRFRLSTSLPTRLVKVPLSVIRESVQPILRHQHKPFQSLHLTSYDTQRLVPYITYCDTFVMSVWVGPPGHKVTETGTGYRSHDFIGSVEAPDHSLRILFRCGLQGDALDSALTDFNTLWTSSDEKIPLLVSMRDFVALSHHCADSIS